MLQKCFKSINGVMLAEVNFWISTENTNTFSTFFPFSQEVTKMTF